MPKENRNSRSTINKVHKKDRMLKSTRQVLRNIEGGMTTSKYFNKNASANWLSTREQVKKCSKTSSDVTIYRLATPIGDYELKACANGIHSLDHVSANVMKQGDLKPDLGLKVHIKDGDSKNEAAIKAAEWLQAYFSGDMKDARLPEICHLSQVDKQSAFIPQVWKTLATKVGFGERVSYGELAVLAGYQSTAARAVGTAMRTNPVSILVPCHRVVKSDGKLGNYSGGLKNGLKQWLLEHESK